MLLPISSQQCFFIAILVFIVIGFVRGWRREVISLVFVLLAVILVGPSTSQTVGNFLDRLPATLGFLFGLCTTCNQSTTAQPGAMAPFWSLILFIFIVLLGYLIGNRVFSRPGEPHERFIGIVPAVIAGAFIMGYLSRYFINQTGQNRVSIALPAPDPTNFVPIIIVILIVAVVIGLIAARSRKAPAKK
ncbi:MAG TPA: CvpA family protein [Ktedonobacteraceae bacterium]|nr:CvpA family protein [Ktedonobacteraceae bacterium]